MGLGPDENRARRERDVAALLSQISYLEEEIGLLRRKVADSPRQVRLLEERIAEAEGRAAFLSERNDKLAGTLREAREQLVTLKEEVDRLGQPPAGYRIFLTRHEDDTIDVFTGGRKLRVSVSPNVEVTGLRTGQEVMLNEAMNVVEARDFERAGDVVMLKELLEPIDGVTPRALVIGHTDEERVVFLADSLAGQPLRSGDSLLLETRSGYVYERIPKSEVEELVLEEVPDIDYSDIGGLSRQIEQIRDAVELPFLHSELFREYELRPPKGILLYGPPGCGKTLIAKAVANSLAKKVAAVRGEVGTNSGRSYFLNIKGPELLNKYVGETERHIRLVFQRAREKASEGMPVIVFFDEMNSIFRTRGSGVSSDGETTTVPQPPPAAGGGGGRGGGGPGERHRPRRLQPRGHDRPGDPAAGPAGRQDQDRAAGRRGGQGHLLQVRPEGTAAAPRGRLRERRVAPGVRGRDDPAHGGADVHRVRGEPVPRGHLRQRRQGSA